MPSYQGSKFYLVEFARKRGKSTSELKLRDMLDFVKEVYCSGKEGKINKVEIYSRGRKK